VGDSMVEEVDGEVDLEEVEEVGEEEDSAEEGEKAEEEGEMLEAGVASWSRRRAAAAGARVLCAAQEAARSATHSAAASGAADRAAAVISDEDEGAAEAQGQVETREASASRQLAHGGQGDSPVSPHTRGSVSHSLTGNPRPLGRNFSGATVISCACTGLARHVPFLASRLRSRA